MQLNIKSFNQVVQDMGAALQASATSLVDISLGSVLRAIFESNAAVVLWLQWLILQVLSMTRAATSVGKDLDSWMADFGVTRLPATPATGLVTFSRFSTTLPALIPLGTVVKTGDGTISFTVTADPTRSVWQQALSAYVIPSGVTSCDVTASCLTAGSLGNVLTGNITMIASSLPGVDQVTNNGPFANGTDLESDPALRVRFQAYLASLSRATLAAIESAISGVQQGVTYLVKENMQPDGTPKAGTFFVIIDDGSGYPASDLISSVFNSVDLVRPIGISFSVVPPIVQTIEISLVASISDRLADYTSFIQAEVSQYINNLGIERAASITRVAQAAYKASAAIDNITGVKINGAPVDVTPPVGTVLKVGQITVTLNAG